MIRKYNIQSITYDEEKAIFSFQMFKPETETETESESDCSVEWEETDKKQKKEYIGCYRKYKLKLPKSKLFVYLDKFEGLKYDKKEKVCYWEGKKTNMPYPLKKYIDNQ